MKSEDNIFLILDWIDEVGGAEAIAHALDDVLAPQQVFALLAHKLSPLTKQVQSRLTTSTIQRLPFAYHWHRKLLALYPRLIETFDLSDANIIFSASHCVAKGVLTRPDQLHISYIHTPARYLWDQTHAYVSSMPWFLRSYTRQVFHRMRTWDVASSNRVDLFLANSEFVRRRIWKFYRRPSIVIYPFIRPELFAPTSRSKQEYFVIVSRLVRQKQTDLAVAACSKAGLPLKVIGAGPELNRLQRMAGPRVEFLGRLPFEDVGRIVSEARGLLFPQEEDFGIVPLESQAWGTPVLAYGRGGALETVIPGKTGDFFKEPSVDSLLAAIREWKPEKYQQQDLLSNARRFSYERFKSGILKVVESALVHKRIGGSFDDTDFVSSFDRSTQEVRTVWDSAS